MAKAVNTAEIFWSKVNKTPDCWIWSGTQIRLGYGQFCHNWKKTPAHRYAYEQIKGKIPSGYVLDHLCRNPSCVNPDHLEVVTNRTNILRGVGLSAQNAKKTHCKRGHSLSGNNLKIKNGHERECKSCWKVCYRKIKENT